MTKFKILFLLFALLFQNNTYAEGYYDIVKDNFYYYIVSLSPNEYTVSLNHTTCVGDVVVPDSIEYLNKYFKVIKIDGAFRDHSDITSVTIPGTVQSIDDYSFDKCTSLTTLIFKDSTKPLTLGASTILGRHERAGLCNSCPIEYFYCGRDLIYDFNPISSKFLKTAEIGESVTKLSECFIPKSITEFTIPNHISKIGKYAFRNCENLKEIKFPEKVKSIEAGIFYHCRGIEKISLSSGLTEIPFRTFSGCTSLKNIYLPDSITFIGEEAFYECSQLEYVRFPKELTEIYKNAFQKCSHLNDVELKSQVKKLGNYAFADCFALSNIKLSDNIRVFSVGLFQNCTNLSNLEMPLNVKVLDCNCLENTGITSLRFPKTFREINSAVFNGCAHLSKITFTGNSVPSIYRDAFTEQQYMKCKVFVPVGMIEQYKKSEIWAMFWNLEVDPSIVIDDFDFRLEFNSTDGDLFINDEKIQRSPYIRSVKRDSILHFRFDPYLYRQLSYFKVNGVDLTKEVKGYKYDLKVNQNLSINVFYGDAPKRAIIIDGTEGGFISLNGDRIIGNKYNAKWYSGNKITLRCKPLTGYLLKSVILNGEDITDQFVDDYYHFSLHWDVDIKVVFEKSITLTLQHADNGFLKIAVSPGQKFFMNILANEGWKINTVLFNDVDVTSKIGKQGLFETSVLYEDSKLNVSFEKCNITSIDALESNNIRISGNNHSINISGLKPNDHIFIYDLNGSLIYSSVSTSRDTRIMVPENKIYLVKINTKTFKVIL